MKLENEFNKWFMNKYSQVNLEGFQSGYYLGDDKGGMYLEGKDILNLPISMSYGLFMEFFADNGVFPYIKIDFHPQTGEKIFRIFADYEEYVEWHSNIGQAMSRCVYIGINMMTGNTNYDHPNPECYFIKNI